MAIIETINDPYHFWLWVRNSDSYNNNFTQDGAKALQEHIDQLSEDLGDDIEFDPIAWCVSFTEYKDFDEFQHDTGYTVGGVEHKGYDDINTLDDLRDHTTVIEFDGGIIVEEF